MILKRSNNNGTDVYEEISLEEAIKLNKKENNFFLKIKDKNIYNILNVKYNDDNNVKITIEEYNNDSKNFLK